MSDRHNQDWGVEMTMTPAKLRKACDKVGGVYAMARLLGKGHTPFETLKQRLPLKLLKTRSFANGNVVHYYGPAA